MLDGKTAYEQNKGLVMGYLYRLCHDEDLANELTQETFYQALKQWDQFRGKSNLGTWLCTIARNLYYRSLRKNDAVSLSVIPEPEIPDFTEKVANHSLAVTVHKALHELQEPYREVFTLRTFCDLSYKEIGDLFEKSESWARVTYYRAKRMLQETMKGENAHEKECDTIRDLMPLVLDDVASENSKNMVTRHVEDCKECREYMDQLIADLPTATAEEVRQEQQANQEAARMLRRKKRTRNLRLLLLGILIASVVFCTGLFVWHRMVNLTEPLSLEQYQLNLYQLEDGNIYVTADLYDYRKTGIVYSEQYVERSLYLSVQTHPYEKDTMIQMETGNFGVICLDDYDSIYQGTPDGYKLVWQRGQKISSASTWMELYYFWYIAGERLDSKMIDGDDGKLTYASVEDESRANWIQSQESYYYMRVPEFAPISTSRFTTIQNEADENRIRWMLEGVPGIEEKDILQLFELMNQVQDEMNNSQI